MSFSIATNSLYTSANIPLQRKIHKLSMDQGVLTKVQKSAFESIKNQNLQVGDAKISCKEFFAKLWTGLSQVPGWIVEDILMAGGVANQVMGADANFIFRTPNDWDFKVLLRPQYAHYASFDLLAHAVLQIFLAHRIDPQIPANDFTATYRKPLVTVTKGQDEWALDSYRDKRYSGIDVLFITNQERKYDFPPFGLAISFLHSSESEEPLARSFSGDYKASLEDLRSKTLRLIEPEVLRHGFKNYIKHLCNGFVAKHKESEAILITKFLQEMGNGLEKLQSTIRKYLENHYETDSNGRACYLINFLLATHSIDKWKTVHNSLLPLLRSTLPEEPLLKALVPFLCKSPELALLSLYHFQCMVVSSHQKATSFSCSVESKELLHGESAALQMKFVAKDQSASYLIFKKQSLEEVTSKLAPLVETSSFSLKEMEAFLDFIQPERFNKLKKKLSPIVFKTLSGSTVISQNLPKLMNSTGCDELRPFLLKALTFFQKLDDEVTTSLLTKAYTDLFQSTLQKDTLPNESWFLECEDLQEELFELLLARLKTDSKEHLEFALSLVLKIKPSSRQEAFSRLLSTLPQGSQEAFHLYLQGKEANFIPPAAALPLLLHAFPIHPHEEQLQLLQDQIKECHKPPQEALLVYERHFLDLIKKSVSQEDLQNVYDRWAKPISLSESTLSTLLEYFKSSSILAAIQILFDQTALSPAKRLYLIEQFKSFFNELQSDKEKISIWEKAELFGLISPELRLKHAKSLLDTSQVDDSFTAFELLLKPEQWTSDSLKKKKEYLNTILNFFKERSHVLNLDEASQKKLLSFASQQINSLNSLLSTKKLSKEQKESLKILLEETIPAIAIVGLSSPEGLFKAQEILPKLAVTLLDFEPFKELSLLILQETATSFTLARQEAIFAEQFLKRCWGSSQAQDLLFQFMNKACRHASLLLPISNLYLEWRPSSLTIAQASDLLTFIYSLLNTPTSLNNSCNHILEAYNNKTYEPSTFSSLSEKLTQCLINQKNDSATIQSTLKTISTIAPHLYLKHVEALVPSAGWEMLQLIWDSIQALQLDREFDLYPLFDRLCFINHKESLSLAEVLFSKLSFSPTQQATSCLKFANFLHNIAPHRLQQLILSDKTLDLLSQDPFPELLTFAQEIAQLLLKTPLNNPNAIFSFTNKAGVLTEGNSNEQTALDQQLFQLLVKIQTKDSLAKAKQILNKRKTQWDGLHTAASYATLIQAYATYPDDKTLKINSFAYLIWQEAEKQSQFNYSEEKSKHQALHACDSIFSLCERSNSSHIVNYSHLVFMQDILLFMNDHQLITDAKKLASYALRLIQRWSQSNDTDTTQDFFKLNEQGKRFIDNLMLMLTPSLEELVKAYAALIPVMSKVQCTEVAQLLKSHLPLFKKRPKEVTPLILKLLEHSKKNYKSENLPDIAMLFCDLEKDFHPIREELYTAIIKAYLLIDLPIDTRCKGAELLRNWIKENAFKDPLPLIEPTLSSIYYGIHSIKSFECAKNLFLEARKILGQKHDNFLGMKIAEAIINHSKLPNKEEILSQFAQDLVKDDPSPSSSLTSTILYMIIELILSKRESSLYALAHKMEKLADSLPAPGGNRKLMIDNIKKQLSQLKESGSGQLLNNLLTQFHSHKNLQIIVNGQVLNNSGTTSNNNETYEESKPSNRDEFNLSSYLYTPSDGKSPWKD